MNSPSPLPASLPTVRVRGHARAGHVIVAAMHHVVEAPEHAVSRQAVVSADVLQCLLHAVAGIGTA